MTYSDKIIEHKATKETPKFNEVIATIELSEGDMMELLKILHKSESTWGTQLIIDIENAFARRDYLNSLKHRGAMGNCPFCEYKTLINKQKHERNTEPR